MTAWTVYTNANLAKTTFLWYDNLGDKYTPLHRNGKAAIPKISYIWVIVDYSLKYRDHLLSQ